MLKDKFHQNAHREAVLRVDIIDQAVARLEIAQVSRIDHPVGAASAVLVEDVREDEQSVYWSGAR
jgi:hypothetical protein